MRFIVNHPEVFRLWHRNCASKGAGEERCYIKLMQNKQDWYRNEFMEIAEFNSDTQDAD